VNKTEQNLTDKQIASIPTILSAKTLTQGIKRARISRTTFYEWLKIDFYRDELYRQRKIIVDSALLELKLAGGEAVRILKELLQSKNEGIKFRTASAIVNYIQNFSKLEDIEERVEQLERRIK